MRIPISHPLVLSAALCLTVAARGEASKITEPANASVSEKLRIIRESVGLLKTRPGNERSVLAQKWRNCISGYWRNC